MHISNINDAKTNLSKLIQRVLAGDEIVIARHNEPLVKLIPFEKDTRPRIGGFWKGKVTYRGTMKEADKEIEGLFEASEILPSENA